MKKLFIPKGFHRPLRLLPAFLRCRPVIYGKHGKYGIVEMSKRIMFTESCKYSLDKGDQTDWNKLFGFCFGFFGIHKNSVRAVWRYNPKSDLIEIALYYYKNGKRDYKICSAIPVNSLCYITLIYEDFPKKIYLSVTGVESKSVTVSVKLPIKKHVFGCGLYFGGNRRAPPNITIYEY